MTGFAGPRGGPSPWRTDVAIAALALGLVAFFTLPQDRLTGVIDSGHRGANDGKTANICRSYHRAPFALSSYLPAFYRSKDGSASADSHYSSHFPYLYMLYAAVTRQTEASPPVVRAIAIAWTILALLTVYWILRSRDGTAALLAAVLFATSPLTLMYGDFGELYVAISLGILLAVDGYARFSSGESDWCRLTLRGLPLAFFSSVHSPFVAVVAAGHELLQKRGLRCAFRAGLCLAGPWLCLFAFHMLMVQQICGGLGGATSRAGARGFLAAFAAFDHPIGRVAEAFFERMGAPLMLLGAVAVVGAIRNRKDDARTAAMATTTLGFGAFFIFAFLELFAVHRYALQLFVPVAATLGGPVLAAWLRSRTRWRRALGILLLMACVGMAVHRLSRWDPPGKEQRMLARWATEAGAHAGQRRGTLLLLVRRHTMAAHMSAMYYCELHVTVHRLDDDTESPLWNAHPAVLGINVEEFLPEIVREQGIAPRSVQIEHFQKRANLLFWLNPGWPAGQADGGHVEE